MAQNANNYLATIGRVESAHGRLNGSSASAARGINGLNARAMTMAVTAGNLLANGIERGIRAVWNLGQQAFQATGQYETLTMSLESLIAREISRGQVVQETTTAIRNLSDAERLQLDKLQVSYSGLTDQLGEAQTAYNSLLSEKGADNIETKQASIALRELQNEVNSTSSAINVLEAANGALVTQTRDVRVNQMAMNDALQLAAPRAQELLGWVQKLAIESPFSQQGVAQSFKMAVAMKATTDEAKRQTSALINWATASGQTEFEMQRVSLALGQIRAKGKLSGEEMLQLAEAGISARDMLIEQGAAIGLTTQNFDEMQRKGLIPAQFAIEAIVKTLENDFEGAAKRSAGTLMGMKNSLEDLREVSLRNFFSRSFQAFQPYISRLVDNLIDFQPAIMGAGDRLGDFFGRVLNNGDRVLSLFRHFGATGGLQSLLYMIAPPELAGAAGRVIGLIADDLARLPELFSGFKTGGLFGALDRLGSQVVPTLTSGLNSLADNWERVRSGAGTALKVFVAFRTARTLVGTFTTLATTASLVGKAFAAFKAGGILTSIVALFGGPVTIALAAVTAAITAFAFAYQTNFMGFGDMVNGVMAQAIPVLRDGLAVAIQWVKQGLDLLGQGIEWVRPIIQEGLVLALDWAKRGLDLLGQGVQWMTQLWATHKDSVISAAVGGYQAVIGVLGWVQSKLAAVGEFVSGVAGAFWTEHGALISYTWQNILETVSAALSYLGTWWQAWTASTSVMIAVFWNGAKLLFGTAFAIISGVVQAGLALIQAWWQNNGSAIMAIVNVMWGALRGIFNIGIKILLSIANVFMDAFQGDWKGLRTSLWLLVKSLWSGVRLAFKTGSSFVRIIVGNLVSKILKRFDKPDWGGVGKNIIGGIAEGIRSAVSSLTEAARSAANAAYEAAKKALGIRSPSKAFRYLGNNSGASLALGLQDRQAMIEKAGRMTGQTLYTAAAGTSQPVSAAQIQNQTTYQNTSNVVNYSANFASRPDITSRNDLARVLAGF